MEDEPTRYSLNEVLGRFAREDIEIFCTRTIRVEVAFCHPSKKNRETHPDGVDDIDYDRTWATIHPVDEATGDVTSLWSYDEATGSGPTPLDISGDLGIGPDEKVWKVGSMVTLASYDVDADLFGDLSSDFTPASPDMHPQGPEKV